MYTLVLWTTFSPTTGLMSCSRSSSIMMKDRVAIIANLDVVLPSVLMELTSVAIVNSLSNI
jgi:hypothetical protein